MSGSSPAPSKSPNLHALLLELLRQGGSDLMVSAGHPPCLRLHGALCGLPLPVVTPAEVMRMLDLVTTEEELERLEEEKSLDFAYEVDYPGIGPRRFRGNAFFQRLGPSFVLRAIPFEIPTAATLGLPREVCRLMEVRQGLILVTGPAGSGKTTTLAALVDQANRTGAYHIITVEDPIEFVHPLKKSLVIQRQVGHHVSGFTEALRAALREDPDIILVGELRDRETISLAVTAAETGHLVLGTLNTVSAVHSVTRLVNAFPAGQHAQIRTMLSDSLRGVLAQQLIRRRDGQGLAVAVEVLLHTPAVGSLIREGRFHQIPSAIQTGRRHGMRRMDQSLLELVQQGVVDPREALDRAHEKGAFLAALESGALP